MENPMYDEQDLENPSHTIEEKEDEREKGNVQHIYMISGQNGEKSI
jgi:hypothetical protein